MTLIADDAVSRFEALLGADAVRSGPDGVGDYLDPYPFGDTAEFAPGAAVAPSSAEQVQEIVRAANDFAFPVAGVARQEFAYGGASPGRGVGRRRADVG